MRDGTTPTGRRLPIVATGATAGAVAGMIAMRRSDERIRTGISDGAMLLNMRRKDFTAELTRLMGRDLSRPVALIRDAGGRSLRLAARLACAGFKGVIDVPKGI
ncbi:hypothetical protein [Jannaschia rubra]|uniref:hypothetical protein n=1 Tax=Jannaschia rubra TaxID=282197 RepID=UPI0024913F5D|nr:hypothetical protein [Jannaschia rubra]